MKRFNLFQMTKYLTVLVFVIMLCCSFSNNNVSGDTGPKPSVVIDFKGIENEKYYVTLIAKESSGPWDKDSEFTSKSDSDEVQKKFQQYTDEDGFFFLGYYEDCSKDNTFQWTYYPPSKFKILIYLPKFDRFVVSAGTYERYAFDSYYTVKIPEEIKALYRTKESGKNVEINDIYVYLSAQKSYDYTREMISLACRILLTIAVELFIALLFGFRNRNQLAIIGITNVVTQIILNVLLNLMNYNNGPWSFVFHYAWMEILVFVIEGAIFQRLLNNDDGRCKEKFHPWLYAFVANITSFVVGMALAKLLPGIF